KSGNPWRIRSAGDLTRRVRFVNRLAGSGARDVLDETLAAAGVTGRQVDGYDREAESHFAAAAAGASDGADCCIATSAVAAWFGLGFVPLQAERFDLVMRTDRMDATVRQAVIEALNDGGLRRSLSDIAGYQTRDTGQTRSHATR